MPSKNAKRKRSKIRQKNKDVNKDSFEKTNTKEQEQLPNLLEDYLRQVQLRTLLEIALVYILQSENMSTWKLSDIGKSLFGLVMGGSTSRPGQQSAVASADATAAGSAVAAMAQVEKVY